MSKIYYEHPCFAFLQHSLQIISMTKKIICVNKQDRVFINIDPNSVNIIMGGCGNEASYKNILFTGTAFKKKSRCDRDKYKQQYSCCVGQYDNYNSSNNNSNDFDVFLF
jgi:hypothetical protein